MYKKEREEDRHVSCLEKRREREREVRGKAAATTALVVVVGRALRHSRTSTKPPRGKYTRQVEVGLSFDWIKVAKGMGAVGPYVQDSSLDIGISCVVNQ